MSESAEAPAFEEALAKLEEIVQKLEAEDGDLKLQDSLALFEQGVAMARLCARRLDEAERKIELLMEEHGDVVRAQATDLEAGEDAADASA